MNIWANAVITNDGIALLAKLVEGSTLTIKRAQTGTGFVTPGLLSKQTEIVGPRQELEFRPVSYPETGKCALPCYLTNKGLASGYTATQVGIFAEDPDVGEILFFIAQAESGTGTPVPSDTEMPGYNAEWTFYFQCGQAEQVTVFVDPANTVSRRDLERYLAENGGVRSSPLTIPADGWTETGEEPYKYTLDVSQEDAKATHIPIVSLHRDSLAVAEAAGMCSSAETVDGAVRFWARKVPAEDMEATLALLTPGTGELGAAGGGSAYVLPVATTETAGVVRIGEGLSVTADGTISVSGGGIGEDDVATAEEMETMLDRVFPDPDTEGGGGDG